MGCTAFQTFFFLNCQNKEKKAYASYSLPLTANINLSQLKKTVVQGKFPIFRATNGLMLLLMPLRETKTDQPTEKKTDLAAFLDRQTDTGARENKRK